MGILLIFMLFIPLFAVERGEVRTITMLNGTVYPDAVVENVTPRGIDIGYWNENGTYALKGLAFSDMSDASKKELGYDAARETAYLKKLQKQHGQAMRAASDRQRAAFSELAKEFQEAVSGGRGGIALSELKRVTATGKVSVQLQLIQRRGTGAAAKILTVSEGPVPAFSRIFIDRATLPPGKTLWSSRLYQTGLQTAIDGKTFPVFSESPAQAAELLAAKLEQNSDYSFHPALEKIVENRRIITVDDLEVEPPIRLSSAKKSRERVPKTTIHNSSGAYYWNGYYGYGNYPVYWYYNEYYNPWPRPPRPRPPGPVGPHPPRPHPPRPHPPRPHPPRPAPIRTPPPPSGKFMAIPSGGSRQPKFAPPPKMP